MSLEAWGDDGDADRPYTEERVQELVAEAVAEAVAKATNLTGAQLKLALFYGVGSNKDEIIEAQAQHIEKLQARLSPLRDTQPGRVREG